MKRLDYQYHQYYVWIRPKWELGTTKQVAEYLMVYYKGKQPPKIEFADAFAQPFTGKVKSRDQKPDDAYAMIEARFPYGDKLQVYGSPAGTVGMYAIATLKNNFMKTLFMVLAVSVMFTGRLLAQQSILDIPALHQLVDESESENKLQVKARNQQALATANEQANLTLLEKMKGMYRTLQQRYNTLGTAIGLADIGIYATPMVSRIVSNQTQIVQLVQKNPALIAIGYQSALQFATQAKSLVNYVTGLSLSLGDVNQMKASDRKILFDYVISELSKIQDLSGNMLSMMQYSSLASLLRAANPFQNFIDADKSIGRDIIQNAKYLK
jgi:hypothetical protein